jgi:hypothetical protein
VARQVPSPVRAPEFPGSWGSTGPRSRCRGRCELASGRAVPEARHVAVMGVGPPVARSTVSTTRRTGSLHNSCWQSPQPPARSPTPGPLPGGPRTGGEASLGTGRTPGRAPRPGRQLFPAAVEPGPGRARSWGAPTPAAGMGDVRSPGSHCQPGSPSTAPHPTPQSSTSPGRARPGWGGCAGGVQWGGVHSCQPSETPSRSPGRRPFHNHPSGTRRPQLSLSFSFLVTHPGGSACKNWAPDQKKGPDRVEGL